jgi:hypothetical protein
MTNVASAWSELKTAVERSGYYPALVLDALETALGGEEVLSHVVQHEATFDRSELRRHITVLVITPTRLVVGHVDEHAPDESSTDPYATAGTEAVRLERVDSVVVTRVATRPERYRPEEGLREVVLTIGWGAVSRIDLEPATCGDPECDADHGYTGTASNDDFSLRVSEAADGADTVVRTLAFARSLSEATARASAR